MFTVHFPISGVETWAFLPPVVSFLLAYFGAMAGVTGAFLLLPFQMSVLGYTSPGVSGTNFLYNLFAIPATVVRYAREGRMNWPLALVITAGSLPGIAGGYWLRVRYLTDQARFRPFAGLVLLYLAWKVGSNLLSSGGWSSSLPAQDARVSAHRLAAASFSFVFDGREYGYNPAALLFVAILVGFVGGAYGIGGGAVLAPFCVSVLRLPVHAVAGASLFGTFVSSLAGVAAYASGLGAGQTSTSPDWALGAIFGVGGVIGGYLGAKSQRFIPDRPIKIGLLIVLVGVSFKYLLPTLFSLIMG